MKGADLGRLVHFGVFVAGVGRLAAIRRAFG
jgi:hypothetical protein